MTAMAYADSKTIRQTGLEIAQEVERLEKRLARKYELRELMHRGDVLLDRAERANLAGTVDGVRKPISGSLRTEVRKFEATVHANVQPGPHTPQQAVERLLRAQETILTWLQPNYHHVDGAPDEEAPDGGS